MAIDYTKISKTYDTNRWYPQRLIKEIINFGGFKDGMKILDIECGTGNVAFQLSELINSYIIGVDISTSMLTIAKKKSLEVVCTDVDNIHLPFPNNSFDAMVGAYVVHQLRNPRFLFSECYRILRKGKLILLTFSHEQIEHQHPLVKKFFPTFVHIDKKRFPDIPQIDSLLKSVGFNHIEYKEVLVEDFAIDQEYLDRVKISTYQPVILCLKKNMILGLKIGNIY